MPPSVESLKGYKYVNSKGSYHNSPYGLSGFQRLPVFRTLASGQSVIAPPDSIPAIGGNIKEKNVVRNLSEEMERVVVFDTNKDEIECLLMEINEFRNKENEIAAAKREQKKLPFALTEKKENVAAKLKQKRLPFGSPPPKYASKRADTPFVRKKLAFDKVGTPQTSNRKKKSLKNRSDTPRPPRKVFGEKSNF